MRFLITGFGNIAQRHIANLMSFAAKHALRIEIVVVRASKVEISFLDALLTQSFKTYQSVSKALSAEQIDAAIICSPASQHESDIWHCCKQGIHCFIEKPMTLDHVSASALLAAIKDRQLHCSIGYDLKYSKGYRTIQQRLNGLDTIWKIEISVGQFLPDWRPDKDYRNSVSANAMLGGGALFELSHEIDYFLDLFEIASASVQGQTFSLPSLPMDCENLAFITGHGELNQRPVAFHLSLDMLQKTPQRYLKVYTQDSVLTWDLIEQSISLTTENNTERESVAEDGNAAFKLEIETWLSDILNNQPVEYADLENAVKVLIWIDAVKKSNQAKTAIDINYDQ